MYHLSRKYPFLVHIPQRNVLFLQSEYMNLRSLNYSVKKPVPSTTKTVKYLFHIIFRMYLQSLLIPRLFKRTECQKLYRSNSNNNISVLRRIHYGA